MLVEPTETGSKAGLDQFIGTLRSVAERARAGDESLKSAPHFAPPRRLDETTAASGIWRMRTIERQGATEARRRDIWQRWPILRV
jgi:glycine dehydrogenase subunit 2